MKKRLQRVATVIFGVAVLAAFAYALVDAWNATDGRLPELWRFALSVATIVVGLLCGAAAWCTLVGRRDGQVASAFLVAQLGKYIPGGVVQAAGQVGIARSAGVETRRGVVALTVQMLVQASVGTATGLGVGLTWSGGPMVLRVLLVIGAPIVLLLLDRRWMVWALRRVPAKWRAGADHVADQRSINRAAVALGANLLAMGLTFALLLSGFGVSPSSFVLVATASTFAWTIGFLAVPIPSGLVVREAVLAALLSRHVPTSVIVAASVYQRLATIVAEALLAAIGAAVLRRARRREALITAGATDQR